MSAGKGDRYRPVDWDRYREEWDKIFKPKRKSKKKAGVIKPDKKKT